MRDGTCRNVDFPKDFQAFWGRPGMARGAQRRPDLEGFMKVLHHGTFMIMIVSLYPDCSFAHCCPSKKAFEDSSHVYMHTMPLPFLFTARILSYPCFVLSSRSLATRALLLFVPSLNLPCLPGPHPLFSFRVYIRILLLLTICRSPLNISIIYIYLTCCYD